ncbi:helix-turn-helix domain-containing protein [Burkholderia cepacia]|uniref:helix-turn-helix domain-containing protein n=1 Tax=Burkholderia cepacia TaxID=292 RepID=UPI0021BC2302|nr:helix-turn-helix domain-containing protein [Burkholderia cepacia]
MNRNDSRQRADTLPADFGLDDAGALSAKSALVLKINALTVSRGLSEDEAAALAEMARPVVTPGQREMLRNVSLELLMQTLVSLGPLVERGGRPAGPPHAAGSRVAVCPAAKSPPGGGAAGPGRRRMPVTGERGNAQCRLAAIILGTSARPRPRRPAFRRRAGPDGQGRDNTITRPDTRCSFNQPVSAVN